MPAMRVFELAKELNMPARQMIQKLRTAGVPVSGNFHELSEDQVDRVRNLISGKKSVGDAGLRSRADGTRRVISSRTGPEESLEKEEEPRSEGSGPVRCSNDRRSWGNTRGRCTENGGN
mgnify:CR=1 FL=1